MCAKIGATKERALRALKLAFSNKCVTVQMFSGNFFYRKSTIGTTIVATEENNDAYFLQMVTHLLVTYLSAHQILALLLVLLFFGRSGLPSRLKPESLEPPRFQCL